MARAKARTVPLWWVSIPKPPDYSTPEAITARAQEAAWDGGCPWGYSGGHSKCEWSTHVKFLRTVKREFATNGKVYREFIAAIRKAQEAK